MRIIAILIIFLILISVISLSGCNQGSSPSKSDEEKFVGTWKKKDTTSRIIFYSDGTYIAPTTSGNWSIKDGKLELNFIYKGKASKGVFPYKFSNYDTILTLTNTDGSKDSYIRQ